MTNAPGKQPDPKQEEVGKGPQHRRAEEDTAGSKHEAPTAVQPVEPEQTNLTGAGKAQQRGHLQENVEGSAGQAQRHPDTSAGQHATGSFTGSGKTDR